MMTRTAFASEEEPGQYRKIIIPFELTMTVEADGTRIGDLRFVMLGIMQAARLATKK